MVRLRPEVGEYDAGRRRLPLLCWRFDDPVEVVATAALGGGTGLREWILNVEVDLGYDRRDPDAHLAELAAARGLRPDRGAGLLTAAPVRRHRAADVEGAEVVATVGLTHPLNAADLDAAAGKGTARPGTINVVALLPVPLAPGGLANTLVTVTEAKVQALHDAGIPATGTPSDAVVVCCPPRVPGRPIEPFGGPRSEWGHRLARAAHQAILDGARDWRSTAGDAPRPGRDEGRPGWAAPRGGADVR